MNQIALAPAGTVGVLVLIERGHLVLRAQLRRHLRELLVAGAGVVERLKIGLHRRKARVESQIQRQPADTDAQIGIPICTERPHLVFHDGAAERRVPLIDGLAGRRAARRLAVHRVVAVPVKLRAFVLQRPLDRVTAARRDDIHHDAGAGRRARVDTAQLDLRVGRSLAGHVDLERAGVVVGAGRRPLERDHGREERGAVKVVHAHAARAVRVPRIDSGSHVEHVAESPPGTDRRRAQQIAVDRHRLGRQTGRDHGRLARYRHRLRKRAHFQINVDGEAAAGAHQDPFAFERREAGKFRSERNRARRKILHAVIARGIGDRDDRRQELWSRGRHGDAR